MPDQNTNFGVRMFAASENVYARIVTGEVTDVETELEEARFEASAED